MPVACDDGGCVGSDVGGVVTFWLEGTYGTHQPRRSFLPPLWEARGPTGWLRHRMPVVLPNDADTAHGVQVSCLFDMYNLVTNRKTIEKT